MASSVLTIESQTCQKIPRRMLHAVRPTLYGKDPTALFSLHWGGGGGVPEPLEPFPGYAPVAAARY